jgi:hypothetical protein
MHRLAMCGLLVLLGACGPVTDLVDDVTLSDAEVQDIQYNYQAAMTAVIDLTDFGSKVGSGEIQLTDASLVVPAEENGWQGTFSYTGSEFPGGDGTISVAFTVIGADGLPVDPFAVDISQEAEITMDLDIAFTGSTAEGVPLDLRAAVRLHVDRTVALQETVTINGTFAVEHGDYAARFTATDFAVTYDSTTAAPLDATGGISGRIDIPNFAFDGDVDIVGSGQVVLVHIQVLDNVVEDTILDISDFQIAPAPEPTP